jgi:hypothetical protein
MEERGDSLQEEWGMQYDSIAITGISVRAIDKQPNIFFLQVFLDVVESVNILVNSNGQIVRSDVVGALKMRTYLRWVSNVKHGTGFVIMWSAYVRKLITYHIAKIRD